MTRILAGGVSFDIGAYLEEPLIAQPALLDARAEHGYALCLCSSPPRKLVIREVNEVLYLAVWPNDGHLHAPSCEYFRHYSDEIVSHTEAGSSSNGTHPPARVHQRAVNLAADGVWEINLDLPTHPDITSRAPIAPSPSASPSNTGPRIVKEALSLDRFLHWIWDNTSMTRWSHGWRRDWRTVARSIRTEASGVRVGGKPLNDLIYIPPLYSASLDASIKEELGNFLARPKQSVSLMLVEVKSIEKTAYGYLLRARNVGRPVFLSNAVHASLIRSNPLALTLLKDQEQTGARAVALLKVSMTGKGNIAAEIGALLLTSAAYIPVATQYELTMANLMCANDRTFTKGVGKHAGADFVLRDTGKPVAVLIYSLQTLDYLRAKELAEQACLQAGCDVLKWRPVNGERIPQLPSSVPA